MGLVLCIKLCGFSGSGSLSSIWSGAEGVSRSSESLLSGSLVMFVSDGTDVRAIRMIRL